MADVIHLRFVTAGPERRGLHSATPLSRAAGRLLGTLRRGLAARELRRLDDRLLRDIGRDREDVAGGAGPSRATVAWDPGTGSHLLGAPGP